MANARIEYERLPFSADHATALLRTSSSILARLVPLSLPLLRLPPRPSHLLLVPTRTSNRHVRSHI